VVTISKLSFLSFSGTVYQSLCLLKWNHVQDNTLPAGSASRVLPVGVLSQENYKWKSGGPSYSGGRGRRGSRSAANLAMLGRDPIWNTKSGKKKKKKGWEHSKW
jgi:hypothetical protein